MKTINLHLKNKYVNESETNFVDLYNEATEDYEFWSADYNMHFGYYLPFKNNPFKRDSMLNEMNNQIFKRLKTKKNQLVIDLGCGMGSTMLYGLKKFKNLKVLGVTLSDFQVKEGNKRLKKYAGIILKENYNHTSFKENSADGVCAIESLCHSGHAKQSFKEAYRILKKGHRFVVADAFLKKDEDELCMGSKYSYNQLCKGWDLKGLGNINRVKQHMNCLLYTSPSPRDRQKSRMPSSA